MAVSFRALSPLQNVGLREFVEKRPPQFDAMNSVLRMQADARHFHTLPPDSTAARARPREICFDHLYCFASIRVRP